jgi:hypothetical protein
MAFTDGLNKKREAKPPPFIVSIILTNQKKFQGKTINFLVDIKVDIQIIRESGLPLDAY